MYNLNSNVRYLRKKNGYSLQQLANILGVSKSCISSIESNQTGVSIQLAIKLSSLFKITIDDLIFKKLDE